MTSRMLGRRPPHPRETHPRLALGPFLSPDRLPPTPPIVDWMSRVPSWPMYGNDRWGDCVWAMIGHSIEASTTYGQGATVTVTDADVLKGYADVAGFDPNAGPPGNNPTDQGTVIQDALGYWRKVGVGGHTILAFAEVDHRSPTEVDAALYLFGHLMIGINFPASAMAQFDHGQPWDIVADDGGIEGGHAVNLGYDAASGDLRVVTWARPQDLTAAWWAKYVEEAWVVIAPEWLSAVGTDPEGIDLAALGAAFTELTGEPSPFPAPTPAPPQPPAPTPEPVPTPAPIPDPVDQAYVAAVDAWGHGRHHGANAIAAQAYRTWKAEKGL